MLHASPYTSQNANKHISTDAKQITGCLSKVGGITKGHEQASGSKRYGHYLDCDDSGMNIHICQNLSNCTVYCMQFTAWTL